MRRLRVTLALAALVFVLAACGGSDEPQDSGEDGSSGGGGSDSQTGDTSAQSEPASEVQYTRDQYDLTEDGAADEQYDDATAEDLPFPLPPDSEIITSGQRPDEAYAAVVNVSSGREAYDFYRQALPDAGFEIVSDNRENQNSANDEEGQNQEQTGEENQEQNGDEQNGDEPFSAFMVVESDEYRGVIRLDEERAIIGVSRAAVDQAAEVQQRAEERRAEREAEQQEALEQGEQGNQEGQQGGREAQNQEAVEANPTTDN